MNAIATPTRNDTSPVKPWTRLDGTYLKMGRMKGRMLVLVLQSIAIAILFTLWVVKSASRGAQQYKKPLHGKAGHW